VKYLLSVTCTVLHGENINSRNTLSTLNGGVHPILKKKDQNLHI
jgi:hypothetical protein